MPDTPVTLADLQALATEHRHRGHGCAQFADLVLAYVEADRALMLAGQVAAKARAERGIARYSGAADAVGIE